MRLSAPTKKGARLLLHKAGLLRGVRYWNRNRFRILMYHKFPDWISGTQEALAKQCAHIKRHYEVVSMTEISEALRGGYPLPKNALAVTVDDGYRDFLLNGAPVFCAYKIPVLVYLASGFLDGNLWFWWDRIAYAIYETKRSSFQLSFVPGTSPAIFFTQTKEQRWQTAEKIVREMKKLSPEEREKIANADLPRILEVDMPMDAPPRMAPLRWPEVRQLKESGVDFGAHTITHPILSQISDLQTLLKEIGDSKKRIEEEIGNSVVHFCYPFGHRSDFNEESVRTVQRLGFLTAVSAHFGMNDRNSRPLELARLPAEPAGDFGYFKEILAGVHTA